MVPNDFSVGVVDQRFLARSIGLLNPASPLTLVETASVADAIRLLQSHKFGALVIVDANGQVSGIFTERDVTLKISLSGLDPEKTPVGEVMTKDPHTAEMTTSVAFALGMMSQGGYRHIPIVDTDHTAVGLISVKDIVDYIAHAITKDISQLA